MTDGVQLLFFSVLGLAGQVVAVGGALLAFRLGAQMERRRDRSRRLLLPTADPSSRPRLNEGSSPEATPLLDAKSAALLRQLRLPPVTDQAALFAWYSRLQLEGMALATDLAPVIQVNFRQALGAIRDILETQNLDDRYELLAAALLPVYESLHVEPAAPKPETPVSFTPSPVSRFTANGHQAASAAYRETPPRASEKSSLASLFEQVEAAARARDALTTNPSGTHHGEEIHPGQDQSAFGKTMLEADSAAPGSHLDTSRLSRRLAEILKTADRNDHLGDPADSSQRASEPGGADHGAPDLHLVMPPLKSRLKRNGTLTPEQDVARKAAYVVGQAREWYGRPDITLREVQSACAAFGLEFNEVAARTELAKPLAEEVS
ncbi:MAG: hypothetical protein SNJ67_05655 [Chloracidobacterium sp.]|uniref:Uncharacterized protein n=1 Tax=Chloracidobacterium validum TaxID=2821543 RepID=A0ABX8B8G6_9BACT|nr:hypothetical protein [Chloracidobacterium validum]QUW03234.1 hypothetical protein J8C06_01990 [Chloracidobacterium validum]